jgi:hypothetical protein
MAKGAIIIKIGDDKIETENHLQTEEERKNHLYEIVSSLAHKLRFTDFPLNNISAKIDPNYQWEETETNTADT